MIIKSYRVVNPIVGYFCRRHSDHSTDGKDVETIDNRLLSISSPTMVMRVLAVASRFFKSVWVISNGVECTPNGEFVVRNG